MSGKKAEIIFTDTQTCFSLKKFLLNITDGNILIDFDARTGHNHGTKFRIKQSAIPLLYEDVMYI
ncbi:MAG: hypothetical protein IJP97_05260 [Synergistaceae bacterium]|nr:hypothetical protein [Synergistaceae bacterium]MBR0069885.1 hypothetical protein [Synergistaceae bacterium]